MTPDDQKIEDLIESLSISNVNWSAWALEFIESLGDKNFNQLTLNQQTKVEELWETL